MVSLTSFLLDPEMSAGIVVAGRLDLALSPFDGGGRRRHVQIWELEKLGRGPGRCAINDGFISSSVTGVNFDSSQSLSAMGPFQLKLVLVFFYGGGGRRRGRPLVVHEDSRGNDANFFFFRDLCGVWMWQSSLYLRTCLYSYARMYVFLT
jgi:hypothetical protein